MEAILRQHGPSDRHDVAERPRLSRLQEAGALLMPEAADAFTQVGQIVAPELERYGEVIASDDGRVAGLMVRGEGEDFTERVSRLMVQWGMSEEALGYHRHLAVSFEHKRIFLKLEWRRTGSGIEPQVALYYRRRPSLQEALRILAQFCGQCVPVDAFRALAATLGKDTVHFMAFTARPGRPLWHKLYFSQYLTPDTSQAVAARWRRAVMRLAPVSPVNERWALYHDRLAPAYRTETAFVSIAATEDGPDPSIKFDYPDVSPTVASGLLDAPLDVAAADRWRVICDATGRSALSYLGVRLAGGDALLVKGYADFV